MSYTDNFTRGSYEERIYKAVIKCATDGTCEDDGYRIAKHCVTIENRKYVIRYSGFEGMKGSFTLWNEGNHMIAMVTDSVSACDVTEIFVKVAMSDSGDAT